ncbi:hypothetical protein LTR36_003563 [Oleoguttula mirabilis]|uniref:Uncharacterized protein n=1 Tax=Oleoguttula mirabilis TaxID=1507867 RepID=A0AAV9JK63_9PEZI|nr:hypothetical protein LTR36_003563 [Oleoguttula mirabilis]
MVFREKAKALFKSRSSNRSDTLSKSSSKESSRDRYPSNVYKPGEPMPRPKYRKPPTKEHKEKLDSFSFTDAWRRKSFQSTYSPMGTRAPSRRNSLFSRKSLGGRSSRANSVSTTAEPEKGGVRQREGAMATGAAMTGTRLSTEVEAEGDDDVTNVGISRVQSRDRAIPTISRPLTAGDDIPPHQQNGGCGGGGPVYPSMSTAHDHQPFSEHDLVLALQRSHLAVPTH